MKKDSGIVFIVVIVFVSLFVMFLEWVLLRPSNSKENYGEKVCGYDCAVCHEHFGDLDLYLDDFRATGEMAQYLTDNGYYVAYDWYELCDYVLQDPEALIDFLEDKGYEVRKTP